MNASPGKSAGDLRAFEQFLYLEARLLDEQRWDDWAQLFVADGIYWVPASPGQPNPQDHISLMYETDLLRKIRIQRFSDPNAFSLQPMPRSVHLISNVMLDDADDQAGAYTVRSSFFMLQFRRDVQTVLGGSCLHRLTAHGDSYRIVSKRVDLINCDAALESILVYI